MMGVYEILNLENGRSYVGSTNDMRRRWFNHINYLRRGVHGNPHLQAAYNKYGEGAFSFCVLEQVKDEAILDEREQYWLDHKFEADDNPYNIAVCAEAPARGIPKSEETKRKLSEATKKQVWSEESRKKLSKTLAGRKFSVEHRRKIGDAHRGKIVSEESKQRMREAQKGKIVSEETKHKIAIASTGRVKSEETCRKLSEVHRGKKVSEETKQKLSRAQAKPYPAFIHRKTGEIIPAGENLKRMCEGRGLRTRSMNQVKNGLQEHSDGWMLLDEKEGK